MNADRYDDMVRINSMTLEEWKKTVTPHESWLWCNDLIKLVQAVHRQCDKADVMFMDGDLRLRVKLLRERMEEGEESEDSDAP